MNNHIKEYLSNIVLKLKQGNATEHTYRGDLQILLEAMYSGTSASILTDTIMQQINEIAKYD